MINFIVNTWSMICLMLGSLIGVFWLHKHKLLLSLQIFLIIFVTVTDSMLSHYTVYVLLLCALLVVINSLINLSKSIRAKEIAFDIPFELMSDSDIESEDETEMIQPAAEYKSMTGMFSNFIAFGKMHKTYRNIAYLGIFFIVAGITCIILYIVLDDSRSKGDYQYSAVFLVIPGIVLTVIVFILANKNGVYEMDSTGLAYSPFHGYIHVPKSVIAGRTIAAFLTKGRTYLIELLIGICSVIYGVSGVFSVWNRTEDKIQMWQQNFKLNNIHFVLYILFILIGMLLVFKKIRHVFSEGKKSLLITMEENFRRNMDALEIILKKETHDSLSSLKASLNDKPSNLWTAEQNTAYHYTSLPLWKRKRAFIKKRE